MARKADQSGNPWQPTWEPIDNLVGAAAEVKKYRLMREAEDKKRKETVAAERKARYYTTTLYLLNC